MFDALLDELDDDVSAHVDDAVELVDKDVELDGADDDLILADTGDIDPLDLEAKADELLEDAGESESWSDDPVRMYLTQMGEIPLLTRKQEIALAKKIEITRAKFRRKLLLCDYVIQFAVKILKRVHKGELPFDRTVQVSVTDHLEKEQILGRMPHNLKTIDVLLAKNKDNYRKALTKSAKVSVRREAWKNLGRGRLRAVKLVEELGLRTQRIEPMIRHLEQFSRRLDELKVQIAEAKKNKVSANDRQPMLTEYRAILRACQETPTSLRNRVAELRGIYTEYQRAKRGLSEATCVWSFPLPRSTAIAACRSWI